MKETRGRGRGLVMVVGSGRGVGGGSGRDGGAVMDGVAVITVDDDAFDQLGVRLAAGQGKGELGALVARHGTAEGFRIASVAF